MNLNPFFRTGPRQSATRISAVSGHVFHSAQDDSEIAGLIGVEVAKAVVALFEQARENGGYLTSFSIKTVPGPVPLLDNIHIETTGQIEARPQRIDLALMAETVTRLVSESRTDEENPSDY